MSAWLTELDSKRTRDWTDIRVSWQTRKMTTIRIVSDIHLEFYADYGWSFIDKLKLNPTDVLIVAGDFSLFTKSNTVFEQFKLLCDVYKHVLYVTGNHEYYKSSPAIVHQHLSEFSAKLQNFHWLNNSITEIDGLKFGGTTLWFKETPYTDTLQHEMNDFSLIKDFKPWVYQENTKAIEFIKQNTSSLDVMITHHLPSKKSVARRFANDRLNCFFLCDVEEYIVNSNLKLWVHGHTHDSCEYKLEQTHVICNPFGYKNREENIKFKMYKDVELTKSKFKILKYLENTKNSYAVFNEVDVCLLMSDNVVQQDFAHPIISSLSHEEAVYYLEQLENGMLV